jgi:hypothetical protein
VRSGMSSIVGVVWMVVGLVVASGHVYFANLSAVMPIPSLAWASKNGQRPGDLLHRVGETCSDPDLTPNLTPYAANSCCLQRYLLASPRSQPPPAAPCSESGMRYQLASSWPDSCSESGLSRACRAGWTPDPTPGLEAVS